MSIIKLKEILDEIDYPVLMEFVDSMWYQRPYEIYWNDQENKDDLENGDGHTYSVEVLGGRKEHDGYLIVNADNGCGETITYFFNLSKEVKF